MKNLKHLNEEGEQVYSEAHAKELLTVQAWYNKALQQLNDQLAKKRSDISVKYMKLSQQQAVQQATQVAAKTAANAPTTSAAKTGTINTAGQPVNAQGNVKTQESYNDILRFKEVVNETSYDVENAGSEEYEDLKDYLDAENISYAEDEDETEIDFNDEEVDPEWKDRFEDIGMEPEEDEETSDILSIDDEEESEDTEKTEDELDIQNDADEKKVFYVKVTDEEGDFEGKIYKLFDSGEWRARVTDGSSETFEKLSYDPDYDIYDIIAFLRENYDDAEIISEDEFNDGIENSEEEPKEEIIKEHKIETFEQFLNEAS